MNLISLRDVWLKYKIEFKEDGRIVPEDFWALKGVNIDINRGEVIGIIGENGAGKTTILKLIASMLVSDKGNIEVNGTVSALMEIGAGFQKDLTGKENIYIISSLFGLSDSEIEERYDHIINFAGIGRFINAPVRIYSQGMYMRLAFAIAIHINPDILLIDDTFAVGDIDAQRKCINKIFELKEQGKTIIFVTQDTEMSKRLCTRAIFIREGIIIKKGPVNEICSYYEESVGDKKGIAILQNGLLGIIFNNGKLVLRWKDRTITSNLSGHTAMFSLGREYLSTTAVWQVRESKLRNEILVTGEWPDIAVSQHWRILILSEKEFIWETVMEVHDKTHIEKFQASAIFADEYKGWFTLSKETDFPNTFLHTRKWECTKVDDMLDRVIGVKGSGKASESLPVVVFDRVHDSLQMVSYAGNTGSEIKGRVVTYEVFPVDPNRPYTQGKHRCFSSKVKIFESEKDEKLKDYLSGTRDIMHESAIIRKNLLSLFCKNRKIEIYCEDTLISQGSGLDTKFISEGKEYIARLGHWDIRKKSNEKIVISISWDGDPPFRQIWKLFLQEDNSIVWCIEMKVDRKIKIKNKETEILLKSEYEKWITTDDEGGFERIEKKGNGVILNKYINRRIGLESICTADDFVLPDIAFDCEDKAPKATYIVKTTEPVDASILRYLEIDFKENLYIAKGKREYFKGRVKISNNGEEKPAPPKSIEKRSLGSKKKKESSDKIQSGRLSLFFDDGRGRLLWNGVEFTKGLGLYSSVYFIDRWHDSSQAFWEIQDKEKGRLVAIGHWPRVPVTQIWEINMLSEDNIFWKIKRNTWEDIGPQREQVSVMISDRYVKWWVGKRAQGRFLEGFSKHNGIFWDRLWGSSSTLPMSVKKCKIKKTMLNQRFLPGVVFNGSEGLDILYSAIENTDDLFEARVLQYELAPSGQRRELKEEDLCFEGQIKLTT